MVVEKICCGSLMQNTYFVCDSKSAVLIDASCKVEDVEKLLDIYGVELKGIIVTHAHFDHILHLDELVERFGVNVYIQYNGLDMLSDSDKNLSFIDTPFTVRDSECIHGIDEHDPLIGIFDDAIHILHTPGHSIDSICIKIDDILFTGDTLFYNTVGRTDMFGGSATDQKNSLVKLREFISDCTRFCSGHGDDFTYEEALATINYYSH